MGPFSSAIWSALVLALLGVSSAWADGRWWAGTTDTNWSTAVIGSVPQGFSAALVDVPANKKIHVDIRSLRTAILFL